MRWTALEARVRSAIDGLRADGRRASIPVYPSLHAGWSVAIWWPGKKVAGGPIRDPCPYDFRVDVTDAAGRRVPGEALSHVALLVDFALLMRDDERAGRLLAHSIRAAIENDSDPVPLAAPLITYRVGLLPAPIAAVVWQLIGLQEEFNYPPPRYYGRRKPLTYLERLVPPGPDAGRIIYLAQSGGDPGP